MQIKNIIKLNVFDYVRIFTFIICPKRDCFQQKEFSAKIQYNSPKWLEKNLTRNLYMSNTFTRFPQQVFVEGLPIKTKKNVFLKNIPSILVPTFMFNNNRVCHTLEWPPLQYLSFNDKVLFKFNLKCSSVLFNYRKQIFSLYWNIWKK